MPGAARLRRPRARRFRCSSPRSSGAWGRGWRRCPAGGPAWRTCALSSLVTGLVPLVVLLAVDAVTCGRIDTAPASTSRTTLIVDYIAVPGRSERRRSSTCAGRRTATSSPGPTRRGARRRSTASTGLALRWFPGHGLRARGVDQCELRAETLVTTRERALPRSGPADRTRCTGSASPRTGSTRPTAATCSRSVQPAAPAP